MKTLQTTDETSVTWKKSYCWINVDIWGFRFSRLHMHIAYTGICVCTCRLQNQRYICCFRLADLLSRVWLFGVTISPFRDFCQLRIFGLESKQIGKEKAKSKENKGIKVCCWQFDIAPWNWQLQSLIIKLCPHNSAIVEYSQSLRCLLDRWVWSLDGLLFNPLTHSCWIMWLRLMIMVLQA